MWLGTGVFVDREEMREALVGEIKPVLLVNRRKNPCFFCPPPLTQLNQKILLFLPPALGSDSDLRLGRRVLSQNLILK